MPKRQRQSQHKNNHKNQQKRVDTMAKIENKKSDEQMEGVSSTEEATPSRRGRKPGSKSGFRPIYFVGAIENDEGNIELKEVVFTNDDLTPSEDDPSQPEIPTNKEVIAKFKREYKTEPLNEVMAGPFNRRNIPAGPKTRRPRLKADVDVDTLRFTNQESQGILAGWNVRVLHLDNTDKEGNKLAYVFFKDEVSPGEKRRQPPAPKPVRLSDIEIVG